MSIFAKMVKHLPHLTNSKVVLSVHRTLLAAPGLQGWVLQEETSSSPMPATANSRWINRPCRTQTSLSGGANVIKYQKETEKAQEGTKKE